jgi:hypothetical protein
MLVAAFGFCLERRKILTSVRGLVLKIFFYFFLPLALSGGRVRTLVPGKMWWVLYQCAATATKFLAMIFG